MGCLLATVQVAKTPRPSAVARWRQWKLLCAKWLLGERRYRLFEPSNYAQVWLSNDRGVVLARKGHRPRHIADQLTFLLLEPGPKATLDSYLYVTAANQVIVSVENRFSHVHGRFQWQDRGRLSVRMLDEELQREED